MPTNLHPQLNGKLSDHRMGEYQITPAIKGLSWNIMAQGMASFKGNFTIDFTNNGFGIDEDIICYKRRINAIAGLLGKKVVSDQQIGVVTLQEVSNNPGARKDFIHALRKALPGWFISETFYKHMTSTSFGNLTIFRPDMFQGKVLGTAPSERYQTVLLTPKGKLAGNSPILVNNIHFESNGLQQQLVNALVWRGSKHPNWQTILVGDFNMKTPPTANGYTITPGSPNITFDYNIQKPVLTQSDYIIVQPIQLAKVKPQQSVPVSTVIHTPVPVIQTVPHYPIVHTPVPVVLTTQHVALPKTEIVNIPIDPEPQHYDTLPVNYTIKGKQGLYQVHFPSEQKAEEFSDALFRKNIAANQTGHDAKGVVVDNTLGTYFIRLTDEEYQGAADLFPVLHTTKDFSFHKGGRGNIQIRFEDQQEALRFRTILEANQSLLTAWMPLLRLDANTGNKPTLTLAPADFNRVYQAGLFDRDRTVPIETRIEVEPKNFWQQTVTNNSASKPFISF